MIKVCIIGLVVVACLYVSALMNLKIGGYHEGYIADEWEKPICEKINGIIAMAMWTVLAVLIVCIIIYLITH